MQKIQIIRKKIDEKRLSGKYGDERGYYRTLRHSIKRDLKNDVDLLLIDLIPKRPIQDKWVVELLLDLQGEFTDKVIIPINNVKFEGQEIDEIKDNLKINEILSSN